MCRGSPCIPGDPDTNRCQEEVSTSAALQNERTSGGSGGEPDVHVRVSQVIQAVA